MCYLEFASRKLEVGRTWEASQCIQPAPLRRGVARYGVPRLMTPQALAVIVNLRDHHSRITSGRLRRMRRPRGSRASGERGHRRSLGSPVGGKPPFHGHLIGRSMSECHNSSGAGLFFGSVTRTICGPSMRQCFIAGRQSVSPDARIIRSTDLAVQKLAISRPIRISTPFCSKSGSKSASVSEDGEIGTFFGLKPLNFKTPRRTANKFFAASSLSQ
jgi:hypothetical protein